MSERVLAQIKRVVEGGSVEEGHLGFLEFGQHNLGVGPDGAVVSINGFVFTADEMHGGQFLFQFVNGATYKGTEVGGWKKVSPATKVVKFQRLDGKVGWELK